MIKILGDNSLKKVCRNKLKRFKVVGLLPEDESLE